MLIWSVTVAGATAQTFSGGGDGTKASPYIVKTKADLQLVATMTDSGQSNGRYFKLANDITEPFTGLIGEEYAFMGNFDGDGHCIAVDIQRPNEAYVGLFPTTYGTIKNLQVEGEVVGRTFVGGIVGNPTNGTVLENLVNYAKVEAAYGGYVGGVAGYIVSLKTGTNSGDSVSVINCANYGDVTGTEVVGGVVGYSGQQRGNILTRLVNYGLITAGDYRTAGVVGNPLFYDRVYGIANFGPISDEYISGALGNANAERSGEIYYDKQYAFTAYDYPVQARLTSELIGDGLHSIDAESEFSEEHWLFEEDMLPRLKMGGQEYSDRAILYATPLLLDADNTLNNVDKPFRVVTKNGVTWTSSYGKVTIDEAGNAIPVKTGYEVLVATKGAYSRQLALQVTGTVAGIEAIKTQHGSEATVYTLSGVCLGRVGTLTELGKGIYIIEENGQSHKIAIP